MDTIGIGPALDVLAVGALTLAVCSAAARLASRLGGRWTSGARAIEAILAVSTWLVFVNFHAPLGVAAVLVGFYPLLACEPGRGLPIRQGLTAASISRRMAARVIATP